MSQSLKPAKPANVPANPGCVDFIACSETLDGWLACGWIASEWQDSEAAPSCTLDFGGNGTDGAGTICLFPREDVQRIGSGFVLFVPGGAQHAQRNLVELRLRSSRQSFSLKPAHRLERPGSTEAATRCVALLAGASASERRGRLLKMLDRPGFAGQDTLDKLKTPVFLETDLATLCPPFGLLLSGWFADPFRQVAALRLRCADRVAVLDPFGWTALPRSDVAKTLGATHPDIPETCGFITYVPDIAMPGETVFYEIETSAGEIGFRRLPPIISPGLRAIKDVLSLFDLRHEAMVRAYDDVVGPAVSSLNTFRLARPLAVHELVFGVQPARPVCSIIVPLHGRIDFLEYQLAFFSRSLAPEHELIYVLDDPPLQRATENLAASCLARFGRPFRLLTLGTNLGYGPTNNVGLAHARGSKICFLNSDVFPKRDRWLEDMLSTLAADPRIGVVGALLLYEDDTIQHEGCSLARLPEFAGWQFCLHPNKGRAPGTDESLLPVEAVTGACLLMPAELARALGGFDDSYVIGDFEDADLCRRVQEKGLICVVDRRAQLYHLERQSQGGQQKPWRLNLTLYNAWRFHRRWQAGKQGLRLAEDAAQ